MTSSTVSLQSTSSKNFTVPSMSTKLRDHLNYPEWATEAEMYLTVMDLFSIVDGTVPLPSSTGTTITDDAMMWKKGSMQAKLFMVYNCEESTKAKVIQCETAKEA